MTFTQQVCWLAVMLTSAGMHAEERPRSNKWWVLSTIALVSANVADVQSSVGRYESNGLLRGADGRFSPGRGIAIKSLIAGSIIGTQYLLLRRNPSTAKQLALFNFATAGVVSGVAIRNHRVAKP